MAAHSLSIAKASLLASCLRPDPTKLNRDDLAQFHDLLETTVSHCTPRNIQNTKQWLLQHILHSSVRTAALCKYLASLSKNIHHLPSESVQSRLCRRQLHLLYFLNDILHHAKYHTKDESLRKNIQESVPTILSPIFTKAAEEKKARTLGRLNDLLTIWSKEKYCEAAHIDALKHIVQSGASIDSTTNNGSAQQQTTTKVTPWILPPTHGDPNAPYFDLPAANLMPYIIPNVAQPIRPDQVRPLRFTAGPADESLVNAMKDFLRDVKSIDDPYGVLEDEGIVADIDEMGQISYKNEADDLVGDTYYGWSRAFCEKMKNRDKDDIEDKRNTRSRSPGSGGSRSRSRSRSPRKRRRYSDSPSGSRSPSRDHSRSRGRGLGRSRSPPPKFNSQPRVPSSSPPKLPQPPRFQPASRPHQNQYPTNSTPQIPMSMAPQFQNPNSYTPPPFPQRPIHSQFTPSAGSPPPRPPGWQGPWPPPPPPPPQVGFQGGLGNMMFPPPPPPPGEYGGGFGRR